MAATLNFQSYHLKNLSFARPTQDVDEQIDVELTVGMQTNLDDSNLLMVELDITGKKAVEFQISLAGILRKTDSYEENTDIDEEETSIKIIGASILLPYARALLSMVSSFDGKPPIMLPTINLNEMFAGAPSDQK